MRNLTYEIRLSGLVPAEDLREQVGDVFIAEQELRTVLSGSFADQAELHGFLNRLRAFGLEVVEVRRVATLPEQGPDQSPTAEEPT